MMAIFRYAAAIIARMPHVPSRATASAARKICLPIRRISAVCAVFVLFDGLFSWVGPGVASADPLPAPQGGYGSYHKEYFINDLPKYSPSQLMTQFNSNVDAYFTFTGCGLHLSLNQICQLDIPGGHAPVQVVALNEYGFALKSLPGHPEGEGRMVDFQFVRYDASGNPGNATLKKLYVDAWGPVSGFSRTGPLNSATVAEYSWNKMADNINSRFPQDPPCDPNSASNCPV